ncbi:hypothetical protein SNK03_001880 [Fusarium graminearum]|nr:unnamed protein product [Fusarium graminearum]
MSSFSVALPQPAAHGDASDWICWGQCPKGPERSPQAALFLDPQDDCCVPHCTIGRRPTSQPFSGRPETENALLGTKWCIHVHWVATVAAIHRTCPSDKQTRPRIGCYPE